MNEPTHAHDPKTKAQLDVLEGKLPALVEQHPDEGDFWNAFAAESELIIQSVAPVEHDYARGRIDCMLKNAGMIPGEDEGAPCA